MFWAATAGLTLAIGAFGVGISLVVGTTPYPALEWMALTSLAVASWTLCIVFVLVRRELVKREPRPIRDKALSDADARVQDRLTSVGTFAAGVAHEINNPLSYLTVNLGLLRDALGHAHVPASSRSLTDLLAEIERGAERVQSVVVALRSFAHPGDERLGATDLSRVLDAATQLAGKEALLGGALVREGDDCLPWVVGNEAQLAQVFFNLLLNSAHAIADAPRGGHRIVVRARTEGERAIVEIEDSGCGIAPENLARVWDPFFTTKPVGTGSGLGLFMCHRILQSLGATVSIESRLGQGTTVRIGLRTANGGEQALPRVSRLSIGEQPKSTLARVLVVDDDPPVARALARLLAPHDVEVVHSGRLALERCESTDYDVVFCDLMMPDVSGVDVYEHIERRWPGRESRVVIVTGGAFTARAQGLLARAVNPVIDKPFDARTVRQALERVVRRNEKSRAPEARPN